jgi:glycosyltransferase involved in cell wall biosynthesis
MQGRLRVLMSAYACEPEQGSESGIGWSFVLDAARFHDLWVITRTSNRAAIEKALQSQPLENVHWLFFDLPRWSRFWKRGERGVQLYYYLWQLGIYAHARRLEHETRFDLVHHATFGRYWSPSPLALLHAPFVWGPLGGAESTPPGFSRGFGLRARIYETARNTARGLEELDPLVRLTARRSALALATTAETQERLRRLGCRRVRLHLPVALRPGEAADLASIRTGNTAVFRLLSCGRLLHWKGFDLGLRAFSLLQHDLPASEYVIVGEGPERRKLERLAFDLGVAGKVRFLGQLPRSETFEQFRKCAALVHPSFHDSSGMVCIEAMAAGCPVICLDWAGPALLVTHDSGIKVPADNPEQTVTDLAAAMLRLGRDDSLRTRMAAAAQRRVRIDYVSERRAESLCDLYQETMELGAERIQARPRAARTVVMSSK